MARRSRSKLRFLAGFAVGTDRAIGSDLQRLRGADQLRVDGTCAAQGLAMRDVARGLIDLAQPRPSRPNQCKAEWQERGREQEE